ncbi:hypothetical protein [Primorskyibacter sp. S87]|uniref:hypothetical protein n=1 Tax=Primorskyibacter sp. S87 TaxID=3415126 RepID=UPI003C7C33B8
MTVSDSGGSELERQQRILMSETGVAGSGAARYAAAMHLYNEGLMSAQVLEIYRRCSKFDNEDPVDLARFEGLEFSLSFDDDQEKQ